MIIPEEVIMSKIYIIRGQKVMIDKDLAEDEFTKLRSQIVTSSWGGQRYLPFAFTELGVLQLANVLKSKKARKMSVRILEVFIKMRDMLTTHKDNLYRIEMIVAKLDEHDDQILLIFEYLRQLEQSRQQQEEQSQWKRIGFRPDN